MNARIVDENAPKTPEEQDKENLEAMLNFIGKLDSGITQDDFLSVKQAILNSGMTTEDFFALMGDNLAETVLHREIVDVPCQLLSRTAIPPEYAHTTDACADIRADEEVTIMPGETAAVKTGFALAIPEGYVCHIYPRSGLSKLHGLRIPNSVGVIDAGYRDEVQVLLWNTNDVPFKVEQGMRIAQMDIMPSPAMEFYLVDNVKEYGEDRGGGFGSTGMTEMTTENGEV